MRTYIPTATKRVTQPVDRQIEGGMEVVQTVTHLAWSPGSVAKVGNVKPDAKPASSVRC